MSETILPKDFSADDERWMQRALLQAETASQAGEVPVGAVVIKDGELIAESHNLPIATNDPTGHAEVRALRAAACALNNYRLSGCTLYVTVEPCTMCFGALMHARIERLVYGATEPRAGVVHSNMALSSADYFNHRIECAGGCLAEESAALMQAFFRLRR